MQTSYKKTVNASTGCVSSAGDTVTIFERGGIVVSVSVWNNRYILGRGHDGINLQSVLQGTHLPNHVNIDDLFACITEARKFIAAQDAEVDERCAKIVAET